MISLTSVAEAVVRPVLRSRQTAFLAAVLAAYGAALLVTDGLRFPMRKDEVHFFRTALQFSVEFPPSLAQLRDYPEVITPLAFVLWGQLERFLHDGAFPGRALNLVLSFAILCLIGLRREREDPQALLAALGLLAYPYFLGLSVHLYTDVPAVFLALLGLWLHARRRFALAFACFALAIATRQYMLAVPVALALYEFESAWRGSERGRFAAALAPACASLTIFFWLWFFGGLGPPSGRAIWLPRYPAPMLHPASFVPEYGLYFLAGLGAYFVVPEAILFRRKPDLRALLRWRSALVAAGLLVFFLAVPRFVADQPTGLFDRAVRAVVPFDAGRFAIFYAMALAASLRFTRRDLGFWVVLANFAMMMKSQLAWEKYLLPTLVVLWYLKSVRALDGGRFPPADPTEAAGPA